MRKHLLAAASVLVLVNAAFAETPNLGKVATPEEIESYDLTVDPNGDGLPPGSGTPKQGEAVYAAKCIACHGEKGVGGQADRLSGGQGTIAYAKDVEKRPIKTIGSFWPYATSVFAYIRRAMPFAEPKSLTPDELYAVTAYLLQINGIIGENDTMDAKTLPQVKMPNRDGFYPFARKD
jgi:cytochrome c